MPHRDPKEILRNEISTRATDLLAGFFAQTPYESIPFAAIHQAKRCVVDGIGVALGGVDQPSSEILLKYCRMIGSSPEAQVWGRPDRLAPELAALVNGHQGHVLDFDDTFLPPETALHGTVPLLPALLAVAEQRRLPGKAVLRAFVLGFEAEARLALALGRNHLLAGWHVTATVGPVGSAVGVGVLIGLDRTRIRNAIGIAVTHSGGVTAVFGSMSKAYQCGKAAETGLRSALLAELGFDSAAEPLTHPQGYLNVAASDGAFGRLTEALGERYLILENGFKPYASGVVTHPLIEALIHLRQEGLRADRIDRIDVRVNPFVLQVTGQAEPKTGLEGKFSAYHCAAAALLDGRAGKAQFTDDRVNDPKADGLRRKVNLHPDEKLRKDECRVAVTLTDGRKLERHVPRALGTAENPLPDDALGEKFLNLAQPVIGPDRAALVLGHMWSLDQLDNAAGLVDSLKG
jgi:2-methylcitrate dehydratase PrpD